MNDGSALMRSVLVWGIPLAIVVAALGYETDWGRAMTREAPAPPAGAAQPAAVALLPEYRIEGGAETRKETVDRTLFNPTRRPAPPATQTAGGKSMQHGTYTLTGTTVVGNVATAFLREVKGGKARSVRQGDLLDGVLVAEVKPDRVRLKQGDDVEDLELKIAAGPKTTVQTVTAPPVTSGQPAPQAPVAAAPAAGGSTPAAQPALRPLVPGAAPVQTVRPSSNVGELLAERRRAARAAAEAAANQAAGQAQPGARR